MPDYLYHKDGDVPRKGEIFVFGSNLAGRHGAGAALMAAQKFGAQYGKGLGLMGQSYGIATKGMKLEVLPLDTIRKQTEEFLQFAKDHPDMEFFITRFGCGLAGYKDEQIAPFFASAMGNFSFPEQWKRFVQPELNVLKPSKRIF